MRTYKDTFSGERIYPDKGMLFVRRHSQIFRFRDCKIESLFLQRKNPAEIHRRLSIDGNMKNASRRNKLSTRRTVKQRRGIIGASPNVMKATLSATWSAWNRSQRSYRQGQREEGNIRVEDEGGESEECSGRGDYRSSINTPCSCSLKPLASAKYIYFNISP